MSADWSELRALEQLKARYCRTLDTKDWAAFRALFSDGFISDTTDAGGSVIKGADDFVAFVRQTLANVVTVHQVQQPELELLSPGEAAGIWAMQDVIRFGPGLTMHGFGHYLETYAKTDGEWRITSSKLTRLREELRTPVVTLFVSDRVRQSLQWLARARTSISTAR